MNEYPWKVPFRSVYCPTFRSWLRATAWCHIVLRWWPNVVDIGAQPDWTLTDGSEFLNQHGGWFRRACEARGLPVPTFALPKSVELPVR